VKVLILTMHRDKAYVYYAISAGAEGYLLKEDADTELFKAIEKIRAGDYYISPLLSGGLTHELIQAHHNGQLPPPESLTVREREVLKLVAEGVKSKEIADLLFISVRTVIADLLFISVRTVEHHRANIMRKLNIKKTANLIKYAICEGYTSPTI
jgi:DNA-binding NarL/FixJ family response regulator